MSFCRSSILNDNTTIFMFFQVLEAPWKTINPPKLIPIITLKPCIDKTPSKVRFVSKSDVSSPLKLHPKTLKIELGTPMRPPWRSKAPAKFFKAFPSSQKGPAECFKASPSSQKVTPKVVPGNPNGKSEHKIASHKLPCRGRRNRRSLRISLSY